MSKTPWVFVDCEARGISPVHGVLTEFGAVHYDTRDTFYGRLFHATPDPENPAISIVGARIAADKEVADSFTAWLRGHLGNSPPVFVSDNPAYDWQWIAGMFDRAGMDNPFGHSGRRIGDFLISGHAFADDADRRVDRVRRRFEQTPVERLTRVVVNGPELG